MTAAPLDPELLRPVLEHLRGPPAPGYHRMIDELELELIRRYGAGRDVLRGGLRHRPVAEGRPRGRPLGGGAGPVAGDAGPARQRGLKVVQGSVTDVPLPSQSFDLVYSMKVLAQSRPSATRWPSWAACCGPGGHLLLEFYNPWSLRYLAKRLGGPAAHRRRHHRPRRLHPLRHAGEGAIVSARPD